MPDTRAWAREARLLIVLDAGTREPHQSVVEDVLAIDFLLQHPSVLVRFAGFAADDHLSGNLPSISEADSTEEALLGWKRAVSARVIAPMLGRLIARGLVTHARLGILIMTPQGLLAAVDLAERFSAPQVARIEQAASAFRADATRAHERIRIALAEASG